MAYAGGFAVQTGFECLGILHSRGYELLRISICYSRSGMNLHYGTAPAPHIFSDASAESFATTSNAAMFWATCSARLKDTVTDSRGPSLASGED